MRPIKKILNGNIRLKEIHLPRRDFIKLTGITVAAMTLAACTRDTVNITATSTPKKIEIDIKALDPDAALFKGEKIFGKAIELREFFEEEKAPYLNQLTGAISDMDLKNTNGTLQIDNDGIVYIDQAGIERPIIFIFTEADSGNTNKPNLSAMYMYTPYDVEKESFVPIDEAPLNSKGRLFPIFIITPDGTEDSIFGLGKPAGVDKVEITVPLFKVHTGIDNAKIVTAYEPYSQAALLIDKPLEAPAGVKKVYASLISDESLPKEKPITPVSELSKKVEAATGMVMSKSQKGEYDVIFGDTEERYRIYPGEDGKFDTLTWNIDGKLVEFLNLTDDIVQKPIDGDGNQVVWIQGFSATKNSETGKITWGLVTETYRKETGTIQENLPIFHDYKDKKLKEIMLQNHLNYINAVESEYPPENLFKEEIIEEMTGDYEVGAIGTEQHFVMQTFFPSSIQGQILYGYHTSNNFNGRGNDPASVDALTGRYSPIQFSPVGAVCIITDEGWEMIKCPVHIKEKTDIVRVFGVEDGFTGSGTPINQRYSELKPSDGMMLIQYNDDPENIKKINKGTIVSPAISNRMGVYYSKYHKRIDFRQFEVVDGEIRVLKFITYGVPSYAKDYLNIKGPITRLQDQEFLIFSFWTKIDR